MCGPWYGKKEAKKFKCFNIRSGEDVAISIFYDLSSLWLVNITHVLIITKIQYENIIVAAFFYSHNMVLLFLSSLEYKKKLFCSKYTAAAKDGKALRASFVRKLK